MTSRRFFHILVFTFAVSMVLLRPYAAYQISMRHDTAGDPIKVNSLLQRLIKKKDEHHAFSDENWEAITSAKTADPLPLVVLLSFFQTLAYAFAALKKQGRALNTIQFFSRHKYYLSLSCIRL